jgi:hypothetical protein
MLSFEADGNNHDFPHWIKVAAIGSFVAGVAGIALIHNIAAEQSRVDEPAPVIQPVNQ